MRNLIAKNGRSQLRRMTLVFLSLAALVTLWMFFVRHSKDFTKIPLIQNHYISDVIEPIRMVQVIVLADGGSMGLTFQDSRHVTNAVCLARDDAFETSHLSFGGMVPDPHTSVPIGGIEEKAFLGLLQRWQRQDPEARQWSKKIERYLQSDRKSPLLKGNETEEQVTKGFATNQVKALEKRN